MFLLFYNGSETAISFQRSPIREMARASAVIKIDFATATVTVEKCRTIESTVIDIINRYDKIEKE